MCAPTSGSRPCLDCNGYGKLGLTAMDCQTCRGRGIVTPMTLDEGGYTDAEAAE